MKIGIMTFHRAVNYGAILQTYALQQALKRESIESEVIDYRDNKIDNTYKLFYNKSPKRIIRDAMYYTILNKRNKNFQKFTDNNITLSKKKFVNAYELKNIENDYDKFITGSDQVFNYKLTNWDKNYFLDFISDNNKKNSYAASFGLEEIPDSERSEYVRLLNNFNHISVREDTGKKIVEKITHKNATVDLDPTFLINKEEWEKIAEKPKEKNYIVLFAMQKNDSIMQIATKLAKKTGCEIIFITDSRKRRVKGKYKYSLSPEEWLGYFLYAKYIVTNSFHGLAFAINFNKDFFIELQKPPATANSRLEKLLDMFDLRDRQVINQEIKNININTDWNTVNEKLKIEKEKSIKTLRKIINN